MKFRKISAILIISTIAGCSAHENSSIRLCDVDGISEGLIINEPPRNSFLNDYGAKLQKCKNSDFVCFDFPLEIGFENRKIPTKNWTASDEKRKYSVYVRGNLIVSTVRFQHGDSSKRVRSSTFFRNKMLIFHLIEHENDESSVFVPCNGSYPLEAFLELGTESESLVE